MDADHVAVIGQGFDDNPSFGPFAWLACRGLVLHNHRVADFEWWENSGAECQPLLHLGVTLSVCLLSEVSL